MTYINIQYCIPCFYILWMSSHYNCSNHKKTNCKNCKKNFSIKLNITFVVRWAMWYEVPYFSVLKMTSVQYNMKNEKNVNEFKYATHPPFCPVGYFIAILITWSVEAFRWLLLFVEHQINDLRLSPIMKLKIQVDLAHFINMIQRNLLYIQKIAPEKISYWPKFIPWYVSNTNKVPSNLKYKVRLSW